jgi:hypothetical protein
MSSCTPVTSTNVPGKKVNNIPKDMRGKFELVYPESFSGLMEESGEKTFITFKADEMVTFSESESVTKLNDSLFVSSIGKQWYISLGAEPELTVFKVVKKGKSFELYPMYSMESITADNLRPYFTDVKEIISEGDENGEGVSSFNVTIDDARLASYFDSELPSKEAFKLVKTKK